MKIYENECVGCGFPCMRESCRYFKVPHYYCDCCGEEIVEEYDIHIIDGLHYCPDCAYEEEEYEEEDEEEIA